ncbi:hypothetical protein ABPG77_009899 [Micractinium sp. CCAP 211/92]
MSPCRVFCSLWRKAVSFYPEILASVQSDCRVTYFLREKEGSMWATSGDSSSDLDHDAHAATARPKASSLCNGAAAASTGEAAGATSSSSPPGSSTEGGTSSADGDEHLRQQPQQEKEEDEDEGAAWGFQPDRGGEGQDSDEEGGSMGAMLEQLRMELAMRSAALPNPSPPREPLLSSFDLSGVAQLIRSGRAQRIICMCGAGISVSAGIPDFRTPGSGLYHQLEKYDLPHPEAVFELSYFRENPRPFFLLAKELFPGNYLPTPTHYFMRLLHDKGLLLRCYTQNIDSLEHQAGLPRSAVIAAHGNFDSARCIQCGRRHSMEHVRRAVFRAGGSPCRCRNKRCRGLVKPDIVFFGEPLPERFVWHVPHDFPRADLLLVMGSSLVVHPFASLIDEVGESTPRLLVNRERVGEGHPLLRLLGYQTGGFCFDEGSNYRDALFEGDCDGGVRQLCRLLGWEQELDALIAAGPQPAGAEPGEEAEAHPSSDSDQGHEGAGSRGQHCTRWAAQLPSRARRRHALCVEVGHVLAMPGRRERRLLEIRLLHRQARRRRRRLRQLARQLKALQLRSTQE